MKFGVRQICNVVFRATTTQKIGDKTFKKGQPVFYLDTAKTSSLEGAATSVYAQGGRGNTRLISWEGEKTLTFTVEDALLSPISFAMLSGAGVVKGLKSSADKVHFHQTTLAQADAATGEINLANALEPNDSIDAAAPLFIMAVDEAGDLTGEVIEGEFSLKEDPESENKNPKVLVFNSADKNRFNTAVNSSDYTLGGNGGQYTYQFPYTLNINHTASASYVQGWNAVAGNTGLTGSPQFAEPIQDEYNIDGTTIAILAKGQSDHLYIPSEVWTVSDEETGEDLSIDMPKYLKNPRIDAKTLKTNISDVGEGLATEWNKLTYSSGTTSEDVPDSTSTIFTVIAYDYDSIHKQQCTIGFWGRLIKSSSAHNVKLTFSTGTAPNTKTVQVPVTYELRDALLRYYFNKNKDRDNLSLYKQYKFFKAASDAKKTFDNITQKSLMVDYYVIKNASTVTELQIDATNFAGYYYVEADTLFRRQIDGKDLPANLTFPNVKIQSNFTFSMASSGDPSTFTFTMDAFPGYTYFDKTKKVLCAIQIVDDKTDTRSVAKTVFPHKSGFPIDISQNDSSPEKYDESADSTDVE